MFLFTLNILVKFARNKDLLFPTDSETLNRQGFAGISVLMINVYCMKHLYSACSRRHGDTDKSESWSSNFKTVSTQKGRNGMDFGFISPTYLYFFCSPRHIHFKFVSSLSLEGVIGKILIYFCMRAPPSTKLTVRSVVICSTLTEDKVTFSGEWHAHCTSWFGVSRICEV